MNGKQLNYLRFADDILLITDDIWEANRTHGELEQEAEQVNLPLNNDKT